MKWECKFGNGPIAVVQGKPGKFLGLWDENMDVLQGIQWLAANAEREFDRLRLRFPYLVEVFDSISDGGAGCERKWSRKMMTAIDMEHSLCYFCRLLRARKTFEKSGPELLQRLHDLILPKIKGRHLILNCTRGLHR